MRTASVSPDDEGRGDAGFGRARVRMQTVYASPGGAGSAGRLIGELSQGLPRLATWGNRIVRATDDAPVILRGVNRSGLEYSSPDEQGFLSGASISRAEIKAIVQDWGCNVLRLPFNQDFVLNGYGGRSAEDYRRALDQVIYWASTFGAYTLLDLQWLDAERIFGGNRNFVAPLPNALSTAMWALLAERYREEPAVLYDVFSEPHSRLEDDPHSLNKEDGTIYPAGQHDVTMAEWQPWARKLTESIRPANEEALVFISGVDWAYDLRGMPMDIENSVYSTHVYANKGDDWQAAFGDLSSSVPVFVSEFGAPDTKEGLEFCGRLLRYLRRLGIGWAAWSWFNEPFLVKRYVPTQFGEMIRGELDDRRTAE